MSRRFWIILLSLSSNCLAQTARFGNLVRCGHAIAKTTFNMLPTDSTAQGIETDSPNRNSDYDLAKLLLFLGDSNKPILVFLTKDDLYFDENLVLFPHNGIVTALVALDGVTAADKRAGDIKLSTFESYPYRSFGYSSYDSTEGLYHDGYSSDNVTTLTSDRRLTDPNKVKSVVAQIRNGLKQRIENIVQAMIERARERTGLKPLLGRGDPDDNYDVESSVVQNLHTLACTCNIEGLEDINLYMMEKLLPSPESPKDFGNILVLENIFGKLVNGQSAELRPLSKKDLSCVSM